MQIAILSDIHDHIWNLDKVTAQIFGKIGALIFCGDLCAGFSALRLAKLNVPSYACLGNNDEDHINNQNYSGQNFTWVPLSKEFGEITLDNRKIAFCHYPKLAELLAKSGGYDAVFHGHTHFSRNETYGKTLLVNPGAVCGIQKGNPGIASYALYDTDSNSAQIIEIR